MRARGVYAFEGIDETLALPPIGARRALDLLGRQISPAGWQSLSLVDRQRLVLAGAEPFVDAALVKVADAAQPQPLRTPAWLDVDAGSPPLSLVDALRAVTPPRALDSARWRSVDVLDRYTLCAMVGQPDRLALAYDEIAEPRLTHLSPAGGAHMVRVSDKPETLRRAAATAVVRTTRGTVEAVAWGGVSKGDVLAAARVAGILAAKRTPELVPLCHPVRTTSASVELELDAAAGLIRVRATVEAVDRTGVEMEAMVAASLASLTVYDMIKSVDRWAVIEGVRLESKSGGKSGEVTRPPERA